MAGTVRESNLSTVKARSRLKPGRQPHWHTLLTGFAHLGYQRWPNEKQGRWVLRRRVSGRYSVEPIGTADDDRSVKPDGLSVLDFQMARTKAVELSSDANRPAGRLTVQRAAADYIDFLKHSGKPSDTATSAIVNYILPKLGHCEVQSLTSQQLRQWVAWVAGQPSVKINASVSPDEALRRRRASANRVLTVLKAALNHAYDEGRVPSNSAWGRRVKKFRNVTSSRARYLSIVEARRFLAACEANFRLLVRAALETGCRYGELGRLEVSDFNADAGTLLIRRSKTQKARHVILTAEGAAFFAEVCNTRDGSALMFTRASGQPWVRSHQGFYIETANKRASIDPPVSFHGLRHTYASHCVMGGTPLMIVARNLGHADTRMVEKTYAHLAADYVSDAIRAGAPRFV
jgi:integrase